MRNIFYRKIRNFNRLHRSLLTITILPVLLFLVCCNARSVQKVGFDGFEKVVVKSVGSELNMEIAQQQEHGDVLRIEARSVEITEEKAYPMVSAYARISLQIAIKDSDGISFEFMGDGSDFLGSVFVGYHENLIDGFEATYFLKFKTWQKMTLRWEDFVQNFHPWTKTQQIKDYQPDPTKIGYIGFGRGVSFHRHYIRDFQIKIRNLKIEYNLPAKKTLTSYSVGYERTLSLLKRKQKIRILLLGDSITESGGEKSYGWYFGQKLKKLYGVDIEVSNQAIAGHSVRGGQIIFPRAIASMSDPDMVCIFFGANDCKATDQGLDAADFQKHIGNLIERVRVTTAGNADIVLFTGLPRLTEDRSASAGQVEPLLEGIINAARLYRTAICDTFSPYLAMDAEERLDYYRDTIHANDAGQQKLAEIFFAEFQECAKLKGR